MPEQKRTTVGSVEIAYLEEGAGERPFVLVHGFTGSSDDFLETLTPLAERGRTLAPDQRGHGDSTNTGAPAGYDLDQLAVDFGGFLDELGIASCDLLGHSMGGMVALRFALAHPTRVDSLVLMDTAPAGVSIAPGPIFEALGKLAREQGMDALFQAMLAGRDRPDFSPAARRAFDDPELRMQDRMQAKLRRMDPEAFAALGRSLFEQSGVTDRLGEIACPTTVVVGAEDKPFREPSEVMRDRIPGAHLDVIPNAAHSPQFENPPAWLAAVHAHLDRAR